MIQTIVGHKVSVAQYLCFGTNFSFIIHICQAGEAYQYSNELNLDMLSAVQCSHITAKLKFLCHGCILYIWVVDCFHTACYSDA